jgi:hypothetical protein
MVQVAAAMSDRIMLDKQEISSMLLSKLHSRCGLRAGSIVYLGGHHQIRVWATHQAKLLGRHPGTTSAQQCVQPPSMRAQKHEIECCRHASQEQPTTSSLIGRAAVGGSSQTLLLSTKWCAVEPQCCTLHVSH